ncbi:MAG: 50S ribosomal protein L22 [archaeon]|nr:50S ribosomal protein L22 [archaeon]
MPHFGYSISGLDKDKTAIASGRDLKVSHKNTREVTNTIKGMTLEQAKNFLAGVIMMEQAVPFKRHNKEVGHRKGLKEFKWASGRFPEKSARMVYEVLSNAEANAEYKGLDTERCRIIHSATNQGRKIKRYIERAHGRSTPFVDTLVHIEIVLLEE